METKKSTTHFIARCHDCDFTTEDYIDGREEAYRHARNRKHRVWGEYAVGFEYDGIPDHRRSAADNE